MHSTSNTTTPHPGRIFHIFFDEKDIEHDIYIAHTWLNVVLQRGLIVSHKKKTTVLGICAATLSAIFNTIFIFPSCKGDKNAGCDVHERF
jgi:hypothetical protein